LQAADNRFMLSDIAAALECSPAELTNTVAPAGDREAVAAQAQVRAIRQALVEMEMSSNERIDGRPIEALEQTAILVRELYQKCDYAGATRLLPALLNDLSNLDDSSVDARVLSMLCDITAIASFIVRKLGFPADAWLAAERCLNIARAIEDPALIGYAEFVRATAAIDCGSFRQALSIAEHAASRLERRAGRAGALEMLGMLFLTCACASHGLRSSSAGDTWSSRAVDMAQRTGETTTLGLFFGPTNTNLWRVSYETDAGNADRAIIIANKTNPNAIDAAVRRVYFHADVARAYEQSGGHDREAIRHLLAAERLAPQHVHSSPLVRETSRSLLERSWRMAGGSALRGLCERMEVA
jgi:hypothetical protein